MDHPPGRTTAGIVPIDAAASAPTDASAIRRIDSVGAAVPDAVLDGELVAFRDGQPSF
jgi:hypothetical protein